MSKLLIYIQAFVSCNCTMCLASLVESEVTCCRVTSLDTLYCTLHVLKPHTLHTSHTHTLAHPPTHTRSPTHTPHTHTHTQQIAELNLIRRQMSDVPLLFSIISQDFMSTRKHSSSTDPLSGENNLSFFTTSTPNT